MSKLIDPKLYMDNPVLVMFIIYVVGAVQKSK